MKLDWREIVDLLVDPVNRDPLRLSDDGVLESGSRRRYAVTGGQPVLTPPEGFEDDGWMFPAIRPTDDRPVPRPSRAMSAGRRFQRLLRGMSGRQGAGNRFLDEVRLRTVGRRPRVLIVGGASVGVGCEALVHAPDVDVVSFDVYRTEHTTFVADGHRVPLSDACMDGVWVQAVLEHVYSPARVVSEIARVLRPGGVVYAETPFLQPVHEGAYDYTRFTPSGHRLLFGGFTHIDFGALGGPGAAAGLAIRGLVGGLTRSAGLARVAYAVTLPLGLLDRLLSPRWRADFSTGAYFLGVLSSSPETFDAGEVYDAAIDRGLTGTT